MASTARERQNRRSALVPSFACVRRRAPTPTHRHLDGFFFHSVRAMPPISALHSAQGSKKALQEVKSMSHQVVELLRDGEPREGAFQKTNHGSGVSLKASDLVGVDDGRPVSVTFQTVPQRPSQLVCCEMRPRDLFVRSGQRILRLCGHRSCGSCGR